MPESAEQAAVRDRLARETERRRQAVTALRLAAAAAGYAAGQVSDGLSPAEARCALVEAAEALAEVALRLRRLAGVSGPGRREAAVEMTGLGIPRREIASRLGVSEKAVRDYLRPR
jgi:DNA-binding NarL/FixJ family response regulator